MRAAGVVLVGGRSSRMGSAKAALEWHGSTLLRRVCGLLARAVDGPVIVVRAPGQPLPDLPAAAVVVADPRPGLGPLVGLATGLRSAADADAELAFVAATDLPFLHPAYVRRVLAELRATPEADLAWPHLSGHPQPLAAGYRTALASVVAGLAGSGERRLRALPPRCRARELDADTLLADPILTELDPALDSVRNINSPGDYAEARARPAPLVTVRVGGRSRRVAAATLGTAVVECGMRLTSFGPPAVVCEAGVAEEASGAHALTSRDPELPLVADDTVELGSTPVSWSDRTPR